MYTKLTIPAKDKPKFNFRNDYTYEIVFPQNFEEYITHNENFALIKEQGDYILHDFQAQSFVTYTSLQILCEKNVATFVLLTHANGLLDILSPSLEMLVCECKLLSTQAAPHALQVLKNCDEILVTSSGDVTLID